MEEVILQPIVSEDQKIEVSQNQSSVGTSSGYIPDVLLNIIEEMKLRMLWPKNVWTDMK